jgi:thymidylate synthase (FAD)
MKNVNIEVFMIARSRPEPFQMKAWLRFKGVSEERINAIVSEDKTPGEIITEVAGRRCYMSFEVGLNKNVTKIREDICEYIDNVLASGHGSVLEHTAYTFAIENVSRVFTGEMNRHRAGMAISEGSMRYIRFDDIPYWVPDSIRGPEEGNADPGDPDYKKYLSRKIFEKAFTQMQENYKELSEIWADELSETSKFKDKKNITSMMRRIIGMGVATGGIWTGNIRALRHILTMRAAAPAEEEIHLVAIKMFELLINFEPTFFGDYKKDEHGHLKAKYTKV